MPRPSPIPPLVVYENQFREKFGRDLTSEEKRFYQLAFEALQNDSESEDDNGGNSSAKVGSG